MEIITPEQLVNFFSDEEARINDDVARICAVLTERETGTCRPKNRAGKVFELRMPEDFDATFAENVAARFRAAGWDANIASKHDITGQHSVLRLASDALQALPQPPQLSFYACR